MVGLCDVVQFIMNFDLWLIARWSCYSVAIAFIAPWPLALSFVLSPSLLAHLTRWWYPVSDAADVPADYWITARYVIAYTCRAFAKIWHGHNVVDEHRLPSHGGAIVVFYHGLTPVDTCFILAHLFLRDRRQPFIISDRAMAKIPGASLPQEMMCVRSGDLAEAVSIVQEGHLLFISPGGTREAAFGDQNYGLMWGNRTGFAKVALQANVPIIPMFCQNCREMGRGVFVSWFRENYEKTRIPPLFPMYGMFPVKLTTFVGEPIMPRPDQTAEELAAETRQAVEDLIRKHQRIPGSIWRALLQRLL